MLTINFDLEGMSWGVEDQDLRFQQPTGEETVVRAKVATFMDATSGIRVNVVLPKDMPPDPGSVPPGFKPPAVALAEALLDNRPRIETAQAIPQMPPNGGFPPR